MARPKGALWTPDHQPCEASGSRSTHTQSAGTSTVSLGQQAYAVKSSRAVGLIYYIYGHQPGCLPEPLQNGPAMLTKLKELTSPSLKARPMPGECCPGQSGTRPDRSHLRWRIRDRPGHRQLALAAQECHGYHPQPHVQEVYTSRAVQLEDSGRSTTDDRIVASESTTPEWWSMTATVLSQQSWVANTPWRCRGIWSCRTISWGPFIQLSHRSDQRSDRGHRLYLRSRQVQAGMGLQQLEAILEPHI